MKIKITLLALLLGLCFPLSAQIYDEDYVIEKNVSSIGSKIDMVYGVMAGVTIPRLSDKEGILDVENTAGYQIGMMWGVGLGALEIVPEIWYQHENTKLMQSGDDDVYEMVSSGIEVPIIFAMRFTDWLRFNVGPSFSLMNNSKLHFEDKDKEPVDFGRTRSAAGYVVGLSATISQNFILDVRYTGRFVSTGLDWYNGWTQYEYRYYNMAFNVGYRF